MYVFTRYMVGVIWNNFLNYLSKLISAFDEFLTVENASKQTRKNYKSDLNAFVSWFTETIQTADDVPSINSPADALRPITTDRIEDFKRWLRLSHTPPATINRRLSALRAFFRFAALNGWVKDNPAAVVSNIPLPKVQAEVESNFEQKALPPVHLLPSVHELPAHIDVALPIAPAPIMPPAPVVESPSVAGEMMQAPTEIAEVS